MATSTNYGWSEPDNTSLVRDGAQAIRTLGDAIDTSLWNSGYGQAGKNKIINGDFGIWQRSTSATVSADGTYYAPDRWKSYYASGGTTVTWSRQTFTPGAAPVAGYEGQYFSRISAASSFSAGGEIGMYQPIENVQTFAGQQITVSFWAKADSARTSTIYISQNFGTGGSTAVSTSTSQALTTSWVRYSLTVTLASISGKTIGTNSSLRVGLFYTSGNATGAPVMDVWGFQVEYGAKATPFQTASGGSIQNELAMCQRYYFRTGVGTGSTTPDLYEALGYGSFVSGTLFAGQVNFPVTMRVKTNAVEFSNVALNDTAAVIAATNVVVNTNGTGINVSNINITVAAGGTAFRFGRIVNNNNTAGYLAWSAEL